MKRFTVTIKRSERWSLTFLAEDAESAKERALAVVTGEVDEEDDPAVAAALENADVDNLDDDCEVLDVYEVAT